MREMVKVIAAKRFMIKTLNVVKESQDSNSSNLHLRLKERTHGSLLNFNLLFICIRSVLSMNLYLNKNDFTLRAHRKFFQTE